LLVATVDGVWELRRESQDAEWSTGPKTLAGKHIGSLLRLADAKTIFAGAHSGGLFVSHDDALTWQPAMNGIAAEHQHVFTLYAREHDGKTVLFAGTQPVALYRSDDLGRTWTELAALRGVGGQDAWSFPAPPFIAHVKHITSHPAEPSTLYVCVEQGALLRSFDDGATWHEIATYESAEDIWHHDMHRIVFTPSNPRDLYLASGEGLYHSVDAGATWTHLSTRHDRIGYPDALFIDPDDERTLYIAGSETSPDAWTAGPESSAHPGILRSRDCGASWEELHAGLPERVGGNIEALALHSSPRAPAFFAGTAVGEIFASEDRGETWQHAMSGLPPISKVGHYKKFLATASALLLAIGVFAMGVPASAADPFEIQAILPLSGQAAFIGKADVNALNAIAGLVNRQGGVRGRQIKFVVSDDQSQPAVAVQLLNRVMSKNVPLVIGSTLAGICNAMAPLVKDGPVELCFSPSYRPAPDGYTFSAGVGTPDLMAAAMRFLIGRGYHRVALITSTDATGQEAEQTANAVLARSDNRALILVDSEHFGVNDISVTAQMARIKAATPDVLIAWTTGTPFGTVLHGASDAGLAIPIFSTNGNMSYAQLKQYGQIMPKELLFPGLPSFTPDQLPNGPLKRAVATFKIAFAAVGVAPEAGENQVWDLTLMAIEGLRQLGLNATPAQLRDYMVNIHGYTGVYGPFDFKASPGRGVGIDGVIVQRWDSLTNTFVAMSRPGGFPLR
jgi:ABC-type branched-subunit amino acid transport system substrate-binding protein